MAKSLVLTFGRTHVTTSNAGMRAVASLAPGSLLLGSSAIDDALVDGWLSFIWSSIDLPLLVVASSGNKQVQEHLERALQKIERHLTYQTYMVGNEITLADLSLAVSLRCAGKAWKQKEGSNLLRWYNTITNQDFFK
jgi:glutathione S-transferase